MGEKGVRKMLQTPHSRPTTPANPLLLRLEKLRLSRLPSFSNSTEHLAEDWLCCQHLDELVDQGP